MRAVMRSLNILKRSGAHSGNLLAAAVAVESYIAHTSRVQCD